MKNLILFFLIVCSCHAIAQPIGAPKKLYYLMGGKQLSVDKNKWNISDDYPFKIYTIPCPCTGNDGKLVLTINSLKPLRIVEKSKLSKLNVLGLPELLNVSTLIIDKAALEFEIYLLVPNKGKYMLYKARVQNKNPSIDNEKF